ncbi:MAG TPA: hypothetical protein VF438_00660 [Candidatus Paceibacterota bacterium]
MDTDDDVQQGGSANSAHEYDFSDDFNISEVKDTADQSEPTPLSANGQLPKSLSEAVDKSLSRIAKPGNGSDLQTPVPGPLPKQMVPPVIPPAPVRVPGASINILEQQVKQEAGAPTASAAPGAMPAAPITSAPSAIPRPEPKPDPKPIPPVAPAAPRPDPFREPITALDTEWPFASQETLARHRDREQRPYAMPQKQAAAPVNLPTDVPAVETSDIAQTSTPAQSPAPQVPKTPVPPLSNFVRPASIPPIPPASRPGLTVGALSPQPRQTPVSPQASVPASVVPSVVPQKTDAQRIVPGTGVHPGGLKNIRTYESDVADVLASRPVTKTSMAIAESKKRGEGEVLTTGKSVVTPTAKAMNIPSRVVQQPGLTVELEEKSHFGWELVVVILSVLLIGGGVFGGYYLYTQSPLAAVPATVPIVTKQTPALVPYDTQAVINIDNANNVEILDRIITETDKPLATSTIKEIVLTETKDQKTFRASAPEAVLLAGVPVPDIISRTLAPEWMLGVYSNSSAKRTPFIVVHTNLFQNAFAGMLAWEPTMIRDLQPFLGIPYDKPTPKGTFKDQIVRNKDVRVFMTEDNRTIFEYSFIDNSTLVITASNAALSAIISRLESKAFVR